MSIVNFSSFLTEAKTAAETTAKRTHIEHLEDLTFDNHEGVAQAENHLREFHKSLLGKKSDVTTSTKIDGAPAIHVGMDENGQHFVATKGVFNKNPKLYRTEDEIDRDYDQDHPLNHILKQSLRHLPQTMPRDMKAGEMYKGDIVSVAGGDRPPKNEKGFVTTQPNVIKYKYPKDSQEGRELADSQVGVVWHTKFNRKGEADSISPKDRAKFARSKDVFTVNPEVKANPSNYTAAEQAEFENHMENARREYSKIKPEIYDNLAGHNNTLRSYINQTVRTGEQPSHEGYIQHLTDRQQKDVDSVKTQAAKDRKIQQHAGFIQQATENKKDIESLLKLHGHLQNAKNILVGVADKNSPSTNELPNGEAYGHEGYVTTDKNGGAVKHVKRAEFSKMILTGAGAIGQARAAAQQPQTQPMAEENAPPVDPTKAWMMPGRFQPVHGGHVQGAMTTAQAAADAGATFHVLATHTHDRSNPLDPAQKVEHLKTAMPGIEIRQTTPDSPTILHHVANLYNQGVRDLTVVGGPEREQGHADLIRRYAGVKGPHGFYGADMKISSASTGDREEGAEGAVGASGTAMKAAAAANDFNTFSTMASPYQTPEQKLKMFDDVRAGQAKFPAKKTKAIKEDFDSDDEERRQKAMNAPETAVSSALKKYTPLGTVDELGSALHKGDVKGAILPAAKLGTLAIPSLKLGMLAGSAVGATELARKNIKENTTGSVGGLGFNTGNPAPSEEHVSNYVEASTADADTRDNVLKGMINKSSSPQTHEKVGFKAFDPSKDLKGKK